MYVLKSSVDPLLVVDPVTSTPPLFDLRSPRQTLLLLIVNRFTESLQHARSSASSTRCTALQSHDPRRVANLWVAIISRIHGTINNRFAKAQREIWARIRMSGYVPVRWKIELLIIHTVASILLSKHIYASIRCSAVLTNDPAVTADAHIRAYTHLSRD